jgi:hypothetical protein
MQIQKILPNRLVLPLVAMAAFSMPAWAQDLAKTPKTPTQIAKTSGLISTQFIREIKKDVLTRAVTDIALKAKTLESAVRTLLSTGEVLIHVNDCKRIQKVFRGMGIDCGIMNGSYTEKFQPRANYNLLPIGEPYDVTHYWTKIFITETPRRTRDIIETIYELNYLLDRPLKTAFDSTVNAPKAKFKFLGTINKNIMDSLYAEIKAKKITSVETIKALFENGAITDHIYVNLFGRESHKNSFDEIATALVKMGIPARVSLKEGKENTYWDTDLGIKDAKERTDTWTLRLISKPEEIRQTLTSRYSQHNN